MTGLEVLAALAGVAGSAVSAAGAVAQGNAAARAADYNAKALNQQAEAERQAAGAEASDYRRQEGRKIAADQAARGALGVTTAGSPLMVDEATVREVALGSARYGYRGMINAKRLEDQAKLEKMQGKAAQTAGYLGAGSSLLSGFGSAYGSYYS